MEPAAAAISNSRFNILPAAKGTEQKTLVKSFPMYFMISQVTEAALRALSLIISHLLLPDQNKKPLNIIKSTGLVFS